MRDHKIRIGLIAILATLVLYFVGIRPTLGLRKELQQKEVQYSADAADLKILSQLEMENRILDSILLRSQNGYSDSQILNQINELAKKSNVRIDLITEPEFSKDSVGTLKKYKIRLNGQYPDLMKWVYRFEQNPDLGKLSTLIFEKKKSKTVELQVEFNHLQRP